MNIRRLNFIVMRLKEMDLCLQSQNECKSMEDVDIILNIIYDEAKCLK